MPIGKKMPKGLPHPWRRAAHVVPVNIKHTVVNAEDRPIERSVFGLAAELKNIVRRDRIRRFKRRFSNR